MWGIICVFTSVLHGPPRITSTGSSFKWGRPPRFTGLGRLILGFSTGNIEKHHLVKISVSNADEPLNIPRFLTVLGWICISFQKVCSKSAVLTPAELWMHPGDNNNKLCNLWARTTLVAALIQTGGGVWTHTEENSLATVIWEHRVPDWHIVLRQRKWYWETSGTIWASTFQHVLESKQLHFDQTLLMIRRCSSW